MTPWSFSVGDPSSLAWTFSLLPDPDDPQGVGRELSASWGSFELVVEGEQLCGSVQEGEQLRAAHWYLLPVAEWLVDNWLALFHESRLPQPADSAAEAFSLAVALLDGLRPLSAGRWGFAVTDEDGAAEQTQAWRQRHHLAAAAPEGPLPDVWLRRLDGSLEVSTGTRGRPLFGTEIRWLSRGARRSVEIVASAHTTERAVRALLTELAGGFPGGRAVRALAELDRATGTGVRDEQLAWLIGLQGDRAQLNSLTREVDEAFDRKGSHEPVLASNPVAMLFGSLSPQIQTSDLSVLLEALASTEPTTSLLDELDRLALAAPEDGVAGLADGPAGGKLGDQLAEMIREPDERVDPAAWLEYFGVLVRHEQLSDPQLRAVTLLHGDGRAVVVVNTVYTRGNAAHVVRFTLAHELAHLVYDRLAARTLAQASGPWTPPRRERRANAVAAALLMPEKDLRIAISGLPDPSFAADIRALAKQFEVGVTALVRRLENAGLLDDARAEAVLDELTGS